MVDNERKKFVEKIEKIFFLIFAFLRRHSNIIFISPLRIRLNRRTRRRMLKFLSFQQDFLFIMQNLRLMPNSIPHFAFRSTWATSLKQFSQSCAIGPGGVKIHVVIILFRFLQYEIVENYSRK